MRDALHRLLPDDPDAANLQVREADAIAALLAESVPPPVAARAIGDGQPAPPRRSVLGLASKLILALSRRAVAAEREVERLVHRLDLMEQRLAGLEAERTAGARRLIFAAMN